MQLLQLLGGIDAEFRITRRGREIAALPVSPRLAGMLIRAAERGMAAQACDLAALLSERDIFRAGMAVQKSASDLLDRLESLASWRRSRGVVGKGESGVFAAVDRTAQQLRRLLSSVDQPGTAADTDQVALLLLWAYPDRLARQREPASERYLLASGKGGILSRHSAVRDAQYVISPVIAAIPGQSDVLLHQAHTVGENLLRREFAAELHKKRTVSWDSAKERVVASEIESLWGVTLSSRQVPATPEELRRALLLGITARGTIDQLPWTPAARQLCWRVELLRRYQPGQLPDYSAPALLATLEEWLGPHLHGITSLEKLGRVNLLTALTARLTWQQQRLLDVEAPTRLIVPSGSSRQVDYTEDGQPVLAVKLQEMFGLGETPSVAWGKVPVLLHLLSPAGRPIQITSDLRNFWDVGYQQVKGELRGRYPKHPWPDDPWKAVPTRKTKRALQ